MKALGLKQKEREDVPGEGLQEEERLFDKF